MMKNLITAAENRQKKVPEPHHLELLSTLCKEKQEKEKMIQLIRGYAVLWNEYVRK